MMVYSHSFKVNIAISRIPQFPRPPSPKPPKTFQPAPECPVKLSPSSPLQKFVEGNREGKLPEVKIYGTRFESFDPSKCDKSSLNRSNYHQSYASMLKGINGYKDIIDLHINIPHSPLFNLTSILSSSSYPSSSPLHNS